MSLLLNKTNSFLLTIPLLTFVMQLGCEKKKDVQIQDEKTRNGIFAISELQEKTFQIATGDSLPNLENLKTTGQAKLEKPLTKISQSTIPQKLASIVTAVPVIADAGSQFNVHFVLDKSFLRVYKVLPTTESLTLIEKALVKKTAQGFFEVPFFKIKVEQSGVLKKEKDANGDETSNLVLDTNMDFKDSTHVLLSMKSEDILILGEELDDKNALKEIFLVDRIDKKVMNLSDLKNDFQLGLKGFVDGPVYTVLDASKGSESILHVYRVIKKSEIQDPKLLAQIKLGSPEIKSCPAEVLAQIQDTDIKSNCVIQLAYDLNVESVAPVAESVKQNGYPTEVVSFKPSASTGLIKIPNLSVPTAKIGSEINSYNSVSLADIKDKEFVFRRTFEDGASTILFFGPGASGPLDLVKMIPLENRLVVKRTYSINGDTKPGSIDTEELMSIPVKYMRKDTNGPSQVPHYIETNLALAEVAVMDWSNNVIPVTNSPLSFLDAGQCFSSTSSQTVTDMKNELSNTNSKSNTGNTFTSTQGISFSIEGTYAFKPECMSEYNLVQYWYGGNLQSTFNIKERISFQVHNLAKEKQPTFDLPFPAQNQLGFGVFTTDQIQPDEFGNSARIHTEAARPVIYDFSNGQQMVYTLGGLPTGKDEKSLWMREALIQGTREVVEEWNEALSRAFAGTSLARNVQTNPYVALEINNEESNSDNAGRLGDLNKNFIWNFEKNLDSGLLGMSQAGPNPRSGQIVQNNVLMYSGNLLSQIGLMKERAKILRLDSEMKAQALAALKSKKSQSKSNNAATTSFLSAATNDSAMMDLARTLPAIDLVIADPMLTSNFTIARPLEKRMTLSKTQMTAFNSKIKTEFNAGLKDSEGFSEIKKSAIDAAGDKAFMKRILEQAKNKNALKDLESLSAIVSAELLKSQAKIMTQEQKDYFASRSRQLALRAQFLSNFRKGANCAMTADDMNMEMDLENTPTEVIFKEFYKSTLAHEIGHSLGLTHNFEGSKDLANFRFADEPSTEEDPKGRNYASIMDYIPDNYIHYRGPGPYDVRALRVAYTGLIELDPSFTKQNQLQKGVQKTFQVANKDIHINENNEISLSDFKTVVLGNQSWWRLDASYQSTLPVKYYSYCTDVHVGSTPTCNRWDLGNDAAAISKFYSNEYSNLYPVLNQRGQRVSIRDMDTYISRIFYSLENLRPFVDETFYQAILGYPQESWVPQALGAINSLFTYYEIINRPAATLDYADLNRFQLHTYETAKYDEQGNVIVDNQGQPVTEEKEVLVEARSLQDMAVPGDTFNSISTRGNQYDKVIALLMLTERGNGNPRYESMGLKISYAEFEKYFLGIENPEDSMIFSSIQSVLRDQAKSVVKTEDGFVMLPAYFENTQNELTRFYNILASTVILDADTLEEKYNFASLFRVGSSLKSAPSDRPLVAKLDQSLSSPVSLKYWAFDNSIFSKNLVRSAAQKRIYVENADDLSVLFKNLAIETLKKDSANASISKGVLVGKLKSLNKKEILLNTDETKQGLSFEILVDASLSHMVQQLKLASQIKSLVDQGKIPVDILPALMPYLLPGLSEIKTVQADRMKTYPIFAIANKTLITQFPTVGPNEKISLSDVLSLLVDDGVIENNHNMVVSNLGTINKFVNMLYPELNK